jgi:lipocalin
MKFLAALAFFLSVVFINTLDVEAGVRPDPLAVPGEEVDLAIFKPNPAVDAVSIPEYLGLWYEVYTNRLNDLTIEKGCYCSTATYGNMTDGKISVFNRCTKDSPDGAADTIKGYAYQPDTEKPGELKVKFDGMPFAGDYWILDLGPIVDAEYQYAIVSDNFSALLFVLARDVGTFMAKYDKEVKEKLADLHFKGIFQGPIPRYQGSDCVYN